jgi:hypothetical protein
MGDRYNPEVGRKRFSTFINDVASHADLITRLDPDMQG